MYNIYITACDFGASREDCGCRDCREVDDMMEVKEVTKTTTTKTTTTTTTKITKTKGINKIQKDKDTQVAYDEFEYEEGVACGYCNRPFRLGKWSWCENSNCDSDMF